MPLRGSGDVARGEFVGLDCIGQHEGYGRVLHSCFRPQRHALSRLDERSVEARLGTQEQAYTGVHDAIWRDEARLLRALRPADGCARPRVQSEALAARMEAQDDRGDEFRRGAIFMTS